MTVVEMLREVVFLFTDVRGSTELWERFPERMGSVIARHDAIARDIVTRSPGRLIRERGEGDSLFIVFAQEEAADALETAYRLQAALLAEPWPIDTPIEVRMALHAGEVHARDGDYYGQAPNRTARLRAMSHPKQILVSDRVKQLAAGSLLPSLSLVDLGVHRLRDLLEPMRVYQLAHARLPLDFPPPKSLSVAPNNLPVLRAPFIGREAELDHVRRSLENDRLITIRGPGGAGKTRTALQLAGELVEAFEGGVWFVDLTSVADGLAAQSEVLQVLGGGERGESLEHRLRAAVGRRHLLVILDNCEHLADAAAELADGLVRAGAHVLATSREPLGVEGERVVSLGPMANGTPKSDGVRLFLERAMRADSRFELQPGQLTRLVEAISHIDALPLAIELAAASLWECTLDELADRLSTSYEVLEGRRRTGHERQRSLDDLVAWSYARMDSELQRAFRLLGVFESGWDSESAAAVLESVDVRNLLQELERRSLIESSDSGFELLETLRRFARTASKPEERRLALDRLTRWLLRVVPSWTGELATDRQKQALDSFRLHGPNLRAVAQATETEPDSALTLAVALAEALLAIGRFREAEAVLHLRPEFPQLSGQSGAWRDLQLGVTLYRQGRSLEAKPYLRTALTEFRALSDVVGEARSLSSLALVESELGKIDRAEVLLRHSLRLRESSSTISNLALVYRRRGKLAEAEATFGTLARIRRESGDTAGLARALTNRAQVLAELRRWPEAITAHDEALKLAREIGDRAGEATAEYGKGDVHMACREFDSAIRSYQSAHETFVEIGDDWNVAAVRLSLGDVFQSAGVMAPALGHYRAALELAMRISQPALVAHALIAAAGVLWATGSHQDARAALAAGLGLMPEPQPGDLAFCPVDPRSVLNQMGELPRPAPSPADVLRRLQNQAAS